MLAFTKLIFTLFIFTLPSLWAEIIPIHSLKDKQVELELSHLNKNSIVLLDIDYTLIAPVDLIFSPSGLNHLPKLIKEALENPETITKGKYSLDYLKNQVFLQAKFALVDEKFPSLINQLKQEGVLVLAFTAIEASKEKIEWRIQQLAKFGFDFSSIFPTVPSLVFSKDDLQEFPPAFKSGVLFASKHPKGEVLKQFLNQIFNLLQWHPDKIVLIDDQIENLTSVEVSMQEMEIPFIGFWFQEVANRAYKPDLLLAEFQFKYLAETGIWLSDEEARKEQEARKIKNVF